MFWFVFVPFFWLILKGDWKKAFFQGWIFGGFFWIAGLHWLAAPLSRFLGIPFAPAMLPFLAVCAWHGLMFALLACTANILSLHLSKRLDLSRETALLCTAAPVMTTIEHFFPAIFPIHFANTQFFHLPQVQILDFLGPDALTWLIMGFNAAAYMLLKPLLRRWRINSAWKLGIPRYPAAVFTAFCALVLLNEWYGVSRIKWVDSLIGRPAGNSPVVKVSLIQGAMLPGEPETLAVYRRLTAEAIKKNSPDLVVWPESVYDRVAGYEIVKSSSGTEPVFMPEFERMLMADVPFRTNILMGAEGSPANSGGGQAPGGGIRRNIAFVTGPAGKLLGLVEKRRLFPFGEYLPLAEDFPVLRKVFPYADNISAGAAARPISFSGIRAGVLICYEDIHTGIAGKFVREGANVLFNLTNEARFGRGMEPRQHLELSALRAIETRRFLLRAVNTGMSAVIDPAGRILSRLGPEEQGVLTSDVRLLDCESFYTRHGGLSQYSGILFLSVLLLLSAACPAPWREP